MIPNIVFALGLSPTAGWVYCKLKWKAGAALEQLPAEERRISAIIGVSRAVWNRESKELRHFGLIRIEGKRIVLTDVQDINWRYFKGKLSLPAAKNAVQGRGEKAAKQIAFGSILRNSGPERGQDSGPERGQKSGPVRGHMINNMKNKNMYPVSSSSKVTPRVRETAADDDDVLISDWHLQAVKRLFVELSNGTAWKETRDLPVYKQIAGYSVDVIAIGLCWTVTKSPEHKMGGLKYALPQIRETQGTIGSFSVGHLVNKARSDYLKTRKCIEWGKWDLSEMTTAQQAEILPPRQSAASRLTR